MVSHNEAGRRHDRRARDHGANTGAGVNNIGAPTNSRRSTGYLGRNGRHADASRRNSAPGTGLPTVTHPQNGRETARPRGSHSHGNPNMSHGLLLPTANMSTGAVNNETSTEPASSAFTTPVHRRMINSSPGPQPIPFSGSRLSQVVPEAQRRPSPMTPTGHEFLGSFTTSPTPIRMVNIPRGNSVEDQYVLPNLVTSNITVARRGTPRRRSNNRGGDDSAVMRRVSNPRLRAVLTSSRLPRPRQTHVSERPVIRMSGNRESRHL